MSKGRDAALIRVRHMLDACKAIDGYVARGPEVFEADATVRDAILYQIIVIGEAAKAAVAADSTIESEFPDVEWSPWAKMRDFVTHQYWRTNHAIVWSTAAADVPRLADELRRVR